MPFTINQLLQVTWAPYPTADPTPGMDPVVYWGSPGWNGGVHALIDGEFIEPCDGWTGNRPRAGRTQWVRVVEIDRFGVYVDFANLSVDQRRSLSGSAPTGSIRPAREQISVTWLRSRVFRDAVGNTYQPDPDNQCWQETRPQCGENWVVVLTRTADGVTYVAPVRRVAN